MGDNTRCRPTQLQSSPLAESDIPTINNCYMFDPQPASSRKRQRLEPLEPNETSQPVSKKRRFSHPSGSQPPAAFWDNLSKIWLTKGALRNARTTPSLSRSPHRRVRRLVTRNFLAESKRDRQAAQRNVDYLRRCEPKILKDIKSFARHGGPDLSDLRNYPEPIRLSDHAMSSKPSSYRTPQQGSVNPHSTNPPTNTTRTKNTRVYNYVFEQHIIDHGIYPDAYEYPDGSVPAEPNNSDNFKSILAQPRPSLSLSRFSDAEFRKVKRAVAHATQEKQVSELVIPLIEGNIRDGKCRSGGFLFTNLNPLTDGTLKPGNPDVYYGARPEQLSRKVRDELGGKIVPSTQPDLPIAPNFFLAAKGRDGSLAVAERQACYNGALGARAMHSLRSYGQDEPVHDNNAYTFTSIYHGGTLKMYTSHVAPPRTPGGRPQYHMTQQRSFAITDTLETCVAGLQAYRNANDWAKEQRNEAIRLANERANPGSPNPVEPEAVTSDGGASPALSFLTAVLETEAYTISQVSINANTNILGDSEESKSSIGDPEVCTLPAKRSSKRSHRSESQRQRYNVDRDSSAGRSYESADIPVSQSSTTSNATTEQSERWSWINGKFQCHKGEVIVKEQDDTPGDVWIYCDKGWPGHDEKKWRLWITATREILYS